MKVALLVEGPSDVKTIPILVKRILGERVRIISRNMRGRGGVLNRRKVEAVITTEEELEEVARQFKEREDVVAIYVFGSFVTRRKRPEDIDVCVITRRRLDLEGELKVAARFPDDVDVIFFYRLPVKVRFNVFRQGRPLLVNDEDALLEVKARTVRQYQDSYRWIQRYRLRWFK